MIRVFIGYDPVETVAFHVAAFSAMRRSSRPVSITGLVLRQLPIHRERDPRQSTEFAFSRFLVPYLCRYEGRAIFLDGDVLIRADIAELLEEAREDKAVWVVQHDYAPRGRTKFLGRMQSAYPRKNWSSVMVFDCARCRGLTPDYVERASGLELHQFRWLADEEIGALAPEWNHLVGEYAPNPEARIAHFTLGAPCFPEHADCEFAEEWRKELAALVQYEQRK